MLDIFELGEVGVVTYIHPLPEFFRSWPVPVEWKYKVEYDLEQIADALPSLLECTLDSERN